MSKTLHDARKEFPMLEGRRLNIVVEGMFTDCQDCNGIEVYFPDWPEAEETAKRYPDKVTLGNARGPEGKWRRLRWIGDER